VADGAVAATDAVVEHPLGSIIGGVLGAPLGPIGIAGGVFIGGWTAKKLQDHRDKRDEKKEK
jgi:phage tail tape-measure protein